MTARSIALDRWVEQARAVPIEDELARRGIKLNGKVERAGPCPNCGGDDRFSISTAKQVFNCRKCGGRGDVIALVQFLDGVDFVEACTTLAGSPPAKPNGKDQTEPRKVRTAVYDYHDESGALLFRVERHEYQNSDGSFVLKDGKHRKTFVQRRPDPNKPSGWIYNVDGVRVVPYKLPELLEAISCDHFVAVVEGEAKADLLWLWNVPATCNACGAGKWRSEHSEFLRGGDVVILPDNDEPGRNHAELVAASLHGIAKSVRILELPGLEPKEDIFDWAKHFWGTVEELHRLIAHEAKPWTPRAKPEQQATENQAKTTEAASVEGISVENFYAYMPMHSYIYVPTREPWPVASVNARLPPMPVLDGKGKQKLDDKGRPEFISASKWLDQNRPVSQMTWAPGEPLIIADRLISHGGWIDRSGEACLNVYLPPAIVPGNAAEADPWLEHVHKVYPNDAAHIVTWLAHRAQRPAEKINHALVLGGSQGTGKDTLLEPIKRVVGPWNFIEVMPSHMLGRFNGFLKAVILRINEARDLGEVNRFAWYDHMKACTAAPPDVLRVDEKNLREHSVLNCCGVIITTNHKTDGIYLPADDRRHYVAWCELSKEDFASGYWNSLWGWYTRGGYRHVAAYLLELDISTFDAKAPPPQTVAFWDIVTANRAPEDAELADVLDRLSNPDATTLNRVRNEATGEFLQWITDRKNRRVIPHRFESCGYTPIRNDAAKDGQWKIAGTRQTVYAKKTMPLAEQLKAARRLTEQD
jgi:hypothetical protein